ncbi:glycosyl transferase family 8 [Pectobacterium odoriferum]|uniref:Glycosyl transferase family 8 n=1 Tax=Pectobacterium odoriferum TaxID=78398 RepID=A0ABD6VMD2_9GAMM|nr:glycosyltransferase [Pectobacterium odoriferum]POD95604.1 glycosyl transferase family 8 [Pectobacterium odoriferum]POE11485.1 glycosyl transferase family 8 [Pectobacterium odoriferum]POE25635.1 glycosyl transferase family 8 [Pectobacterium odoriferum]POE30024.1 glycosyl transferase family 8 [Pectobacterium odoriferum]POE38901.1 glycosyl transferase family 8 [Pectobacterium odoriferum]
MKNNNFIHIAYCADANYIEYVAVSISSILINNRENSIFFHVFLYDVPQIDIDRIKSMHKYIKVYLIGEKDLENYTDSFQINHLNKSTYIRLLVPRLLSSITGKFIYLDADILCFSDISGINNIDIDNYVCAVATDSLSERENTNAARLGLQDGFYFNAGVLYINIEQWMLNDIEKKTNDIIEKSNGKLKYYDQDALNISIAGKIRKLDSKWNYLFTWMKDDIKENYFYNKARLPFFIHFTGSRKPWYREHSGLSQNLYVFYKHFTPWANTPLKSYKNKMRSTDYRIYSKSEMKKRNYLKGLYFFIKYLKLKIKPSKGI